MLLEWKDEYLLGIESLDFEHGGLFETINELHAQCHVGASLEDVEACLGKFHAHLAAYFALEEYTMGEMQPLLRGSQSYRRWVSQCQRWWFCG